MRQKNRDKLHPQPIQFNHKIQNIQNVQQQPFKHKLKKTLPIQKQKQPSQQIKSLQNKQYIQICQLAKIYYQMSQYEKSLSSITKCLSIKHKNCNDCLQLLLKLINQKCIKLEQCQEIIKSCLQFVQLPENIKYSLLKMQQQIIAKDKIITPTTNRQFRGLWRYYKTRNAKFLKIQVSEVNSQYRVAIAKERIFPFQIIIRIPLAQLITLQKAKSQPQLSKLIQKQNKLKSPKHTLLCMYLLFHKYKKQSSPYFNYINCMPKKLNTFPIYYKQQQLKQLQNTYFIQNLKRKKQQLLQDYHQIIKIFPNLNCTYNQFTWARMIISSRIFGIAINNKKTDALVPIADMLNHRTPKSTSWSFHEQDKCFIVQNSRQIIQQGEQIFDSYGTKCNSRFLLSYGFIQQNNRHNQIVIILKKMKPNTPDFDVKIGFFLQQEFQNMLSYYRHHLKNQQTEQHMSQDSQYNNSSQNKIYQTPIISLSNQLKTWQLVQQTMIQKLSLYKTTTRQDRLLLRDQQLLINIRNCIEIRHGQKKILKFYIRMAKVMKDYICKDMKIQDWSIYRPYIDELNLFKQTNN